MQLPIGEEKVYTVGELLRKLAGRNTTTAKLLVAFRSVTTSDDLKAKAKWLVTIVRRVLSRMPASEDVVDALLEAAWSYSRMRMHRAASALLVLALNPHIVSSYAYTLYPWPLRCTPSAYGYMRVRTDESRLLLLTIEACGRSYGLLVETPLERSEDVYSDIMIIDHHRPIAEPKIRVKPDLTRDTGNPLGVATPGYESLEDVLESGNPYLLVEMLATHYHENDRYPLYNPGLTKRQVVVFDYSERRGVKLIELRFPGEGEVRLKMWRNMEGGERVVNLEVEEATVDRMDLRVADWYARRARRRLYAEAAARL